MCVEANSIPEEIISVIDIKRIQLDLTIQHRIILETVVVVIYNKTFLSEQFK